MKDVEQYTVRLRVRDYECDYQGIVNNAVYLNYLEHARHVYLKNRSIRVIDLAQQGINLVVVRIEIDYKQALRSGDTFGIGVELERLSRVRFVFNQQIYRLPSEQLAVRARTITTAVNPRGRPFAPKVIEKLFSEQL
jgi:acyl-CoA thioester hydrolase